MGNDPHRVGDSRWAGCVNSRKNVDGDMGGLYTRINNFIQVSGVAQAEVVKKISPLEMLLSFSSFLVCFPVGGLIAKNNICHHQRVIRLLILLHGD